MKTTIPTILLALSVGCLTEEPNPFVKKNGANTTEAPGETPADPSFASILEHVLVPPEMIDAWIAKNGNPDDAAELRATVQQWIVEGKATLDHTAVTTGVAGTKTHSESVVELIYPTEYKPIGPGVWPMPTAFETRKLGYDTSVQIYSLRDGQNVITSPTYTEINGGKAWHGLIEKTRHPDDVLFPRISTRQITKHTYVENPDTERDDGDADLLQLLARIDPSPAERQEGSATRLVFSRSELHSHSPGNSEGLASSYRASFALMKVSHLDFSKWIQERTPLAVKSGIMGLRGSTAKEWEGGTASIAWWPRRTGVSLEAFE